MKLKINFTNFYHLSLLIFASFFLISFAYIAYFFSSLYSNDNIENVSITISIIYFAIIWIFVIVVSIAFGVLIKKLKKKQKQKNSYDMENNFSKKQKSPLLIPLIVFTAFVVFMGIFSWVFYGNTFTTKDSANYSVYLMALGFKVFCPIYPLELFWFWIDENGFRIKKRKKN